MTKKGSFCAQNCKEHCTGYLVIMTKKQQNNIKLSIISSDNNRQRGTDKKTIFGHKSNDADGH